MAASQEHDWWMRREEELHQFLPVSESLSSVWSGLAVKDSLRFMEDLALPSFTSNSLRSSFGVLVNGDSLSLFCREENKTINVGLKILFTATGIWRINKQKYNAVMGCSYFTSPFITLEKLNIISTQAQWFDGSLGNPDLARANYRHL